MDQLKSIMSVLKRQHFWVLCGLAALICMAAWFTQTSKLAGEFQTNETKAKSYDSKLASRIGKADHPSEKSVEGYKRDTEALRERVRKFWDEIYQVQVKEVFVWPDTLPKRFLDSVRNLGPKDQIPFHLRDIFKSSVKGEFNNLLAIVKAPPAGVPLAPPPVAAGPGGVPVAAAPPATQYKILWDDSDQVRIQSWFDWGVETPTSLQIRYAQEDLWVYQAVCKIIAKMNETARVQNEAAIKMIVSMKVGFDAAEEVPGGRGKRIWRPQGTAMVVVDAPPAADGAPSATKPQRPVLGEAGPAAVSAPIEGEAAAAGPVPVDQQISEWRYVDGKGVGLTATALQTPPFVEYKLLPFELTVTVDQRDIDRLLVEFHNSVLPFAVRQVRMNPRDNASAEGPPQQGLDGVGGRTSQHDVMLSLLGVVYIVNPPNPEKLGITPEGSAPADQGQGVPVASAAPSATFTSGEKP